MHVRSRIDVAGSDWQGHESLRPDQLLAQKQSIETAEKQRVAFREDGAFEAYMMQRRIARELAEERRSDNCSVAQRRRHAHETAEQREARSRAMRAAWERGCFADRVQWCKHRTPTKTNRAINLRAAGATWKEIADRLGVTQYTAMRWCGWERPAEPTNRKPVTIDGVTYESQREAARALGVDRAWIRRQVARGRLK